MKKSKKITIGVISGLIVAAIAGTLLGVFIPPLLKTINIDKLVQNQVKPAEGEGNFLKYNTKPALTSSDFNGLPYADKLETIERFSKYALNTEEGFQKIISGKVSNYVVEFWKNYKKSAAYTERFKDWEKEINESWDNEVENYKKQYGKNWEYYFQLNVLDPVGGNEDGWKRKKLIEKANSTFDEFLFETVYINALRQDKTDVLSDIDVTNIPQSLQEYLMSPEMVNGDGGTGKRNRIVFQPSNREKKNDPISQARAKFQEFVFMEYVKNELPLMTTMTLWNHVDPSTLNINGYQFFNIKKGENIISGSMSVPSGGSTFNAIKSTREGSEGEETPPSSSSTLGVSSSYKWQAYPAKSNLVDSSGQVVNPNTTDKYLSFATIFNSGSGKGSVFIDQQTGLINISKKYTDDSATLYPIRIKGGANEVFNTSFVQYAAGSTYKFNEAIGMSADPNVPTIASLSINPIIVGTSGTELMSNFLKSTNETGFFKLPNQVVEIINDDNAYYFKGLYNGIKYAADTINITDSPFILTRNEKGIHIIGIDRYSKIKEAQTYEGKINEIANTILWRHFSTTWGLNADKYLDTGFSTGIDEIKKQIKDYYTSNRDILLYKYILQNETSPSDPAEYIFSENYTDVTSLPALNTDSVNNYINAWIDLKAYGTNLSHDGLVKSKLLGISNAFSLGDKNFGNKVIENGIASVQPYTRNTTEDAAPSRENQGYVEQTFGMYNSLTIFEDLNSAQPYKFATMKTKKDLINTKVNELYTALNNISPIGMKKLTYQSARYNQYLQVGYPQIPSDYKVSDEYYVDNMDLLNEAVSSFITNKSTTIKNIVDTQRSIADLRCDPAIDIPKDEGNSNVSRAANNDKLNILDINNLALSGTYTDPTTIITTEPQMPSQNDGENKDYVNYQLQKAFDSLVKLPSVTTSLSEIPNADFNKLMTLARNKWATPLLNEFYSDALLNYIKEVMGIKYAFDFNEKTGKFEFTKFKNYLVQQTSNYKKAAFVWVNTEAVDWIDGYETKTIEQRFTPKTYAIAKSIDVNGYAYQGAQTVDTYKASNGKFKDTVTLNKNDSYFKTAKLTKDSATSYLGFNGMVFESTSDNADISGDISSALFSNELNVFAGSVTNDPIHGNATTPLTTTPTKEDLKKIGSMYNMGSREILAQEMEDSIFTWEAVTKANRWLNTTFDVNVDNVSMTDLAQAKKDLKNIILTEKTKIPDDLFTRNVGSLLASSNSIFNKELPIYFGDTNAKGSYLTQVIFTQFNYFDVVKLFDINGDDKLDENDVGINWVYAATNGFLGTSAEAFFMSAMQWYKSQSSYANTAYNKGVERQGKFETFDRRLNDLFGEALVSNWKENL